MFREYWTDEFLVNLMTVLKTDRCYRLCKDGADAVAYRGVNRSGDECVFVAENSRMAEPDEAFLKNDLLFVCDYRRISVKFGHEKDGVALIRVAFKDLREAAQFVLADIAASEGDWREITVDSLSR